MGVIFNILNNRKLYYLLILLNILASIAAFILAHNEGFADAVHYLNLAESLEYGKFSAWYFIAIDTPDTLRTPGYPLFLFFLRIISDSILFIKFVQLTIYYVTLFLSLKLLNKFDSSLMYKNLLLVILLPNVQIAYYTGCINAETLNVFFIILLVYAYYFLRRSFTKYIILGLISGTIFLLRPAFLLFPILFVIYDSFFSKKDAFKYKLIYIIVYGIMLIPYGLWNYYNHGIFKIIPLEGGAGILHLGYWQHKLPGYRDTHYWLSYMGDEIVRFVKDDAELEQNLKQYDREWKQIDSECAGYFTKDDAQRKKMMTGHAQVGTYGSDYVKARERLLLKYSLKHIIKEPLFFIRTRLYTAIRLWVTGINREQLSKAKDLKTISKIVYPFAITFTTFVFGFLFIAWSLAKKLLRCKEVDFIIILVIYYGLIHIPFVIQSRYTIPVHLLVFILMALVIGRYLNNIICLRNSFGRE